MFSNRPGNCFIILHEEDLSYSQKLGIETGVEGMKKGGVSFG